MKICTFNVVKFEAQCFPLEIYFEKLISTRDQVKCAEINAQTYISEQSTLRCYCSRY